MSRINGAEGWIYTDSADKWPAELNPQLIATPPCAARPFIHFIQASRSSSSASTYLVANSKNSAEGTSGCGILTGILMGTHDSTLGAALVGLTLSSILYGATLLQCFLYFTNYYNDSRTLKTTVIAVCLVDTVHTIIVTHILYYYLVVGYGDPNALNYAVWSLGLEVGLTTLAALIAQSFFTWRVWILSHHNKLVVGILISLVAIAFGTGIVCMFEIWKLKSIPRLSEIEWLVSVKHSTVAAADIGVALMQCWYLHLARTGLPRTDSLINALMIYSINRGVLNSIAAVADLTCFLIMPDNFIWLALNFVVSKLYSNSLLATLNTRNVLRGKGEDNDLTSTLSALRAAANPGPGLNLETQSFAEIRFACLASKQDLKEDSTACAGSSSASTSAGRLSMERQSEPQVFDLHHVNRKSSDEISLS